MRTHSGNADATGVTFRLGDRPRRLAGVRLITDFAVSGERAGSVPFDRIGSEWQLRLDEPEVDRMEYLFEVTDHNARAMTIPDPGNPRRVPGAFGEKSVVEFADYRPPSWLDADEVEATTEVRVFAGPGGDTDPDLEVGLWSPSVLDDLTPAPLLAVHDGPEFASLGGFLGFVGSAIAAGTLPPLRVALLGPGDRNAWYAADDEYAAALCTEALPGLPPTTARVGVGASLGALAMLHAHRRHPGTFAGLFLQSGSFFTPELDAQESDFSAFDEVSTFVASVHDATSDTAPVPTTLTCGTVEENLSNNAAMTRTLDRLGYAATLHRRRDTHNFVAWRDALDPHLTRLVQAVARAT